VKEILFVKEMSMERKKGRTFGLCAVKNAPVMSETITSDYTGMLWPKVKDLSILKCV